MEAQTHEEEDRELRATQRVARAVAEAARRAPGAPLERGEGLEPFLPENPRAWMLQSSGFDQLSKSQRESARRSYAKWPLKEMWDIQNYVSFVQARFHERRERANHHPTIADEHTAAAMPHVRSDRDTTDPGTEQADAPDHAHAESAATIDTLESTAHDVANASARDALHDAQHATDSVAFDDAVHVVQDHELREVTHSPPPHERTTAQTGPASQHEPAQSRDEHQDLGQRTFEEPSSTVQAATNRIKQILVEAKATRERDTAAYKAQNLPQYPRSSQRRIMLLDLGSRGKQRTFESPELRALDALTRRVAVEIVDNPLWIAADYIERNTKLTQVDHHALREDPRVREARGHYRRCEKAVLDAKQRQEQFLAAPAWKRTATKLFGDREKELHETRMRTSAALVEAKAALDALEQQARHEMEISVAEQNALATERREQAVVQRESLERSLRETLVERALAELALSSTLTPLHLKHARDGEALEYAGPKDLGAGFSAELLLNARDGRVYIGDTHEMKAAVEQLDLSAGEPLLYRAGPHGGALERHGGRSHEPVLDAPLLGQVVEIGRWDGDVWGVRLRDKDTERDLWLSRAQLDHELSPRCVRELRVGDELSLHANAGQQLHAQRAPQHALA